MADGLVDIYRNYILFMHTTVMAMMGIMMMTMRMMLVMVMMMMALLRMLPMMTTIDDAADDDNDEFPPPKEPYDNLSCMCNPLTTSQVIEQLTMKRFGRARFGRLTNRSYTKSSINGTNDAIKTGILQEHIFSRYVDYAISVASPGPFLPHPIGSQC